MVQRMLHMAGAVYLAAHFCRPHGSLVHVQIWASQERCICGEIRKISERKAPWCTNLDMALGSHSATSGNLTAIGRIEKAKPTGHVDDDGRWIHEHYVTSEN